ncbi:DNA alkylation repair protein [Persicobacter diffluens]|uniref:DNA alkylation repair protein n=1 Tax=Persicobacter diffluens TaxID=981 RepID=A0AAN5AMF6_9BACT|nr:hypothetical protein PEDI_29030 [Persicobacter diffluens]
MNPTEYFQPLRQAFEALANPDEQKSMKAYMKGQFDYYGIRAPERREAIKYFLKEARLPLADQLPDYLHYLWEQPEREWQYMGIELIQKMKKKWGPEFILTLEELVLQKSWWDTIDFLATHGVGAHFQRFPEQMKDYVEKWCVQENIWLRRTAILYQLKYKQATDLPWQQWIIEQNLGTKEFFLNKAIGWSLREISKTNAAWVEQFVEDHPELAQLSKTEALKWIKKNA